MSPIKGYYYSKAVLEKFQREPNIASFCFYLSQSMEYKQCQLGHVAQSVTRMTIYACLTAYPGVASSIPA